MTLQHLIFSSLLSSISNTSFFFYQEITQKLTLLKTAQGDWKSYGKA